jgi:PST family polysaccharide transporter
VNPGRVGSDAAWSLAYLVAMRLATFGISVAVARMLGVEGAGAFGVAVQVSTFGAVLAGMNLAAAVSKEVAAAGDVAERRAILGTSLRWVVAGGVVVALALVLGAQRLAVDGYRDASLAGVLVATGPLAFATALFVWAEGALQGLRWFRRQAVWGSAVGALDLVVGLIAALGGVVTLVIARTAVRVAAVGAFALRLRSEGGEGPLLDAASVRPGQAGEDRRTHGLSRRLFDFALPSLLASTAVFTTLTVMRVILVHHAGLHEAGHYQVADSLAQGLLLVPFAAAAAFMPAVARGHAERSGDLGASMARGLRRVVGFNLPLCLLAIAWGSPAIRVIYGSEFAPAVPVLALLALAAALSGLSTVFGAVQMGRGEARASLLFNALWGLTAIALFRFVWIDRGAVGAAAALAGAHAALLLLLIGASISRWGVSFRRLWGPVAASAGSALLVTAWTLRSPSSVVPMALGTITALAVFARWGLPELRAGSLAPTPWRPR